MDIIDIADVKRAHRGHWFSASTMRFFRSRVAQQAYRTADRSRAYFVSSEQFEGSDGYRAPRLYSVRVIDFAKDDIDTVGEFQQYGSRSAADRAARKLAEIPERLAYLRSQIEAEQISYSEISELQSLAEYIDPSDVVLLEWAGVPEFPDDEKESTQ